MSWKGSLKDKVPLVSDKVFGVVMGLILLAFSMKPLIRQEEIRIYLLIPAAILIFLGVVFPRSLSGLNIVWSYFSLFNAAWVREVVSLFVFVFIFVPMGLGLRFLGKDLLNLKQDQKIKSYWVVRKEPLGSLKNQF